MRSFNPTHHQCGWWCIIAITTSVVLLPTGCRRDRGTDPNYVCRVDYTRLGGEGSDRFDVITREEDSDTVMRFVYARGETEPKDAIYYNYSTDGRLDTQELDREDDEKLDSSIRRVEILGGLIEVTQADAIADDGKVDVQRFEVPLPTTEVMGWNPARITFSVACEPERVFSTRDEDGVLIVELDREGDGEIDASMELITDDAGRLRTWIVDVDQNGEADFSAQIFYNARGHVEEFFWKTGEGFMGTRTFHAIYRYDDAGNLRVYEADSDVDGVIDNQIFYASTCYDESQGGAQ